MQPELGVDAGVDCQGEKVMHGIVLEHATAAFRLVHYGIILGVLWLMKSKRYWS